MAAEAHVPEMPEQFKEQVKSLFKLENPGLVTKVYNEKGNATSDFDIAAAYGIGVNEAADINGVYVYFAHFLFSHDMTTTELSKMLASEGFDSKKADVLLDSYSNLNDKGKQAVRLLDMSLGVPPLAPHWEKVWFGFDYRPLHKEGKTETEGLIPMIILKLGINDQDTNKEQFMTIEMSIMEFRSTMNFLRDAERNMMKQWEENHKMLGPKLLG